MKILVIDNYDSFTYNLVHALKKFEGVTVEVRRNDELAEDEPDLYDKIVFSPGPGLPQEAGSMPDIIRNYSTARKQMARIFHSTKSPCRKSQVCLASCHRRHA